MNKEAKDTGKETWSKLRDKLTSFIADKAMILIIGGGTLATGGVVAAEATIGIPLLTIPGVSATEDVPAIVKNPTAQPVSDRSSKVLDASDGHFRPLVAETGTLQAKTSTVGFISVYIGDPTFELFLGQLWIENVTAPHLEFFNSECGRYYIDGNRIEAGEQINPTAGTPDVVVVPPPSTENSVNWKNFVTDEISIKTPSAAGWMTSLTLRDLTMDGHIEIHKIRAGECVIINSVFGDGDTQSGLVAETTNMFGPTFLPEGEVIDGNTDEPLNVRSQ